jgi:hypothetical protein
MRPRTPTRLILACALLFPALTASATAPGSLDAREREFVVLQFVCANNSSQVCTTHLPASPAFDPAQCPATPAPQECVIDFIPNAEIRALMTVIGDDPSPADQTTPDVRISVLLEFQIGEEKFVIAESFTPGNKIADWFPIFDEHDVFSMGNTFYATNVPIGATTSIGDRLVQIAIAKFGAPANSIATLRAADPKTPELEVDQSGATQATGSVARYRVTIRFAKPAPPPI